MKLKPQLNALKIILKSLKFVAQQKKEMVYDFFQSIKINKDIGKTRYRKFDPLIYEHLQNFGTDLNLKEVALQIICPSFPKFKATPKYLVKLEVELIVNSKKHK